MSENEIAHEVVDAALCVHRALGPGLLEGLYEEALVYELTSRGIVVQRQVAVPVYYGGTRLSMDYRLDLLVGGSVIVELKSVEELRRVHYCQLLTYLRIAHKHLGLLINFHVPLLKDGIHRVVNALPE